MQILVFAALAVLAASQQEQVKISSDYLFEDFEGDWEDRWIRSSAMKDGADSNIAKYNGRWEVEEVAGSSALVMKDAHRHYAISAALKTPFAFDGATLVVQYEVKFQEAATCGGAYLKLLSKTSQGFSGHDFVEKTPYTILFGPDKCGSDSKLLFIFRHQNPVTKKWREIVHNPISGLSEKLFNLRSHLLTLVIRSDNTYSISVDQYELAEGTLGSAENFTPALIPDKMIDDPEDKKPADWVDNAKIDDPTDEKPADWDESAPATIPDEDAVKPDEWDESAPETIPDPDAEKPEDWSEEDDGEWEAPEVPNPQCEKGCGKWQRPSIRNPNYKGKWKARQIDNPAYKGVWAPRKIENPEYFEETDPYSKLASIVAVGFELWTTYSGASFDNILITSDEAVAATAANQFWLPKKILDDEKYGPADKSWYSSLEGIVDHLSAAAKDAPYLYVVYLAVLAIPILLMFFASGRSTPAATADVATGPAQPAEAAREAREEAHDEPAAAAPQVDQDTAASEKEPAETAAESDAAPEPISTAASEEATGDAVEPTTPRRSLRKRATKATAE